jgi:hypothetical protein
MTAHCRPVLLLCAASALFLPACLFIGATGQPGPDKPADDSAAKIAEQAHKPLFAELRPGAKIPVKDTSKETTTALRTSENPKNDPPVTPDIKVASDPPPGPIPSVLPTLAATEPPLFAAVRAYAENRPDKAIEILKALDPPNQEFVLAMLPALARGATADLTDPTTLAVLIDQLRTAAAHLAPKAPLLIENVTFCRKVYGFGRYDPWPEGQPYRPNDQAQLYLEVRNLVSQPVVGPHGETYLTHVLAAVEIRDAHGRLVEQPDPEDWRRRVPVVRFEKQQYSRGTLDDFHILHGIQVPAAPGVYTVTVELRDPANRRVAKTAPVEFRVTGP